VIGKHISILYTDLEKEKANSDLEKVRSQQQIVVSGLKLKKRGISFWAKMKFSRIDHPSTHGPKFKVTLQDITHRALSNLRVQTIRDEYLVIFNNPFVGSFKFRMNDYRITMCNQKMLEITGYESSSLASFQDLFHSPHQFDQFIGLLLAEKRVEGFKFLIKDKVGLEDNWAVISVRYFENHGFAEGVLLDISEQHSQMVELQRVNAELDNFTYHASHDLRAPLTTIMGLTNLGLLEDNSVEKQSLYFKMIQDRIGHLDALLKDLISVSFNNRSNTNYESIQLLSEVENIVQTFELPNQTMQVNIDMHSGMNCVTDPVRFRTIIRNLVSNAFKYSDPNNDSPSINIKAIVTNDVIQLEIQDNGIGIDEACKGRIYEMFFRGTTQSSGSGLGLYIVKSMLDKLKGEISFESGEGHGTTFKVTIPNQQSDNSAASIQNSASV
jgi:signal transduction histidine kinase